MHQTLVVTKTLYQQQTYIHIVDYVKQNIVPKKKIIDSFYESSAAASTIHQNKITKSKIPMHTTDFIDIDTMSKNINIKIKLTTQLDNIVNRIQVQ